MRLSLTRFAAGAGMNNSPFRVAFWGLLVGLGLSIALAATSPEEIRLALDSPPPVQFDADGSPSLLAENAAESTATSMIASTEADDGQESLFTDVESTVARTEVATTTPIETFAVPDNRLALDPEQPLLVPPFESEPVVRAVPSPPTRPLIEFDSPDSEGIPIEFDLEGEQPRIHVVVTPPPLPQFEELPPPPVLAQVISTEDDSPGQSPASQAVDAASEPDSTAHELAELRSFFKQEIRSLHNEIEALACAETLAERRAELFEAQQQLDRESHRNQIEMLQQELERQRMELAAMPAASSSDRPVRVIITPSTCMTGRVDVEFNAAPAAEAFDCLGRLAGQNLITSDEVQGEITAKLQGVLPWDAVMALAQAGNCRIICEAGSFVVVRSDSAEGH